LFGLNKCEMFHVRLGKTEKLTLRFHAVIFVYTGDMLTSHAQFAKSTWFIQFISSDLNEIYVI